MYTYYLKAPCTPQNGATDYVIRGITTPFSLSNNDPNYSSIKNSPQYQSSISFPDNSIYFGGTDIMSIFNNRSLKYSSLKPNYIHECSALHFVKEISYINIP